MDHASSRHYMHAPSSVAKVTASNAPPESGGAPDSRRRFAIANQVSEYMSSAHTARTPLMPNALHCRALPRAVHLEFGRLTPLIGSDR